MSRGFVVATEEELDQALFAAERHRESFCLLDVRLDPQATEVRAAWIAIYGVLKETMTRAAAAHVRSGYAAIA